VDDGRELVERDCPEMKRHPLGVRQEDVRFVVKMPKAAQGYGGFASPP
jgi:hypothetical protein